MIYRAVVYDNKDPYKLGRIRVIVPHLGGAKPTNWIYPVVTGGFWTIPKIGDHIIVGFEAGDAEMPLWLGSVLTEENYVDPNTQVDLDDVGNLWYRLYQLERNQEFIFNIHDLEWRRAPRYGLAHYGYNGPGLSTSTARLVPNLDNGKEYVFRVRAYNEGGAGPWSEYPLVTEPLVATPINVPSAPTSVQARLSDSGVVLTWEPPDRGSASAGYEYRYAILVDEDTSEPDWSNEFQTGANIQSVEIGSLQAGTSYVFQVRGMGPDGIGPWSASSEPVLVGLPTVPTGIDLMAGYKHVMVSWIAPANREVTGYDVQYKRTDLPDAEWVDFPFE